MARDDLFRRSFEAGTAFLDMTRERAEALVKELVKAGEVRKGKAQKVIDDVVERSRKSAEELRQVIRKEIAEQVAALGLATKDDIAHLEAKLQMASPQKADPTSSPEPTKAPPVKRAGPAKAAKKTATPRKAAGASGATGAGGATGAAATPPMAAASSDVSGDAAPAGRGQANATPPMAAAADTGAAAATGAAADEPPVQDEGDAGGPPPNG